MLSGVFVNCDMNFIVVEISVSMMEQYECRLIMHIDY